MNLFNFSKEKTENVRSPEQTLRRIIAYMPDYYQNLQSFKDGVEFVERQEYSLAVTSLVKLPDETGHYFSEEFWTDLFSISSIMNMLKEEEYCAGQIARNEREIGWKTPFGWTTIKIDDTHFQHHISAKLKEEWANKRREDDKVSKLINKNGIHIKSHGRSGFFYLVDNTRIAELEFELGVNGLILYYKKLCEWSLPVKEIMTLTEKQELKRELQVWSETTGNAIVFE